MIAETKTRLYGLDILRALAIIYVMLSHGYHYSASVVNDEYYRWLIFDGVGLFFVLSGFLIGGILIRKIEAGPFGLPQLGNFWLRRWLRTLPAYFFVLSFLLAVYYFDHGQLPPFWAKYYVFTQNFASAHPLFFGEAWSLSVEEWFYVLLPLILFFVLKLPGKKSRQILCCIVLALIGITFLRIYKVQQHDYFADNSFGPEILRVVVTRMDAILFGVLGAWLSIYHQQAFYRYKNALLVFGLASLIACNMPSSPFFHTHLRYTLLPIGALCLLPALSALRKGSGGLYRVITFISIISYCIYLTNHMIVQRGAMPLVIKWLGLAPAEKATDGIFVTVIFWSLTLAAAYALHLMVERPFMRLRNKLKSY